MFRLLIQTVEDSYIQECETIKACRDAWCEYRDNYGIGSSQMLKHCGDICDDTGRRIARVSYNGRVWDTTTSTPFVEIKF